MRESSQRRQWAPIYLAQLPWIGPVLGEGADVGQGPSVRVAVGADPALGDLHSVVFLPVQREAGGRRGWQPVEHHDGWYMRASSREASSFDLPVPASYWARPIDGLLVAVIYDRSRTMREKYLTREQRRTEKLDLFAAQQFASRPGRESGHGAFLALLEELIALYEKLDPSDELRPVDKLPEPMRTEVVRRVRELVSSSGADLSAGVIELSHGAALAARPTQQVCFAVGSCQYPAGFLDREVACHSYRRLADRLSGARRSEPQCLLLLGDQIYADSTAGLFDPSAKFDRFDEPHERLLRLPPVRQVLRRILLYAMLDDHEILDNWEPRLPALRRAVPPPVLPSDERSPEDDLQSGRETYLRYQRMAGPPQSPASGDSTFPLWYPFSVAGFPFFMADTRTERTPRNAETVMDARIMSKTQFDELLQWLGKAKEDFRDKPKFVASPACLLPRHVHATPDGTFDSALRSDAWDGYPASLFELLEHIVDKRIEHVVFLSGDEHLSFAVSVDVENKDTREKVRLYSVHSSGMYSPLPFSNAVEESLRLNDRFCFVSSVSGHAFVCTVRRLRVTPGDGFALIRAQRLGEKEWSVKCLFDRAGDSHDDWFPVFPEDPQR